MVASPEHEDLLIVTSKAVRFHKWQPRDPAESRNYIVFWSWFGSHTNYINHMLLAEVSNKQLRFKDRRHRYHFFIRGISKMCAWLELVRGTF